MLRNLWHTVRRFLPDPLSSQITHLGFQTHKSLHKKMFKSRPYSYFLDRKVKRWTEIALMTGLQHEADYPQYIYSQIRKSFYLNKSSASGPPLNNRTIHLVSLMQEVLPEKRDDFTLLCVGCRNTKEMDHIEQTCKIKTSGLDLFSEDQRIMIGDMHNMVFPDNTFNGVYSCHSLEHSHDFRVALREFVRVTKPGGLLVIEVPINFRLSESDRWDAKSTKTLIEHLGTSVDKVVVEDNAEDVARLIVSIRKNLPR